MRPKPKAETRAQDLQPVTLDRPGLFWFSFVWFYCTFRVGNGPPKNAFQGFRMSKALMEVLKRCPDIAAQSKIFHLKSDLWFILSSSLVLIVAIVICDEIFHQLIGQLGFMARNSVEYNEATAVGTVVVLLMFGATLLLWIDLYRELHHLVGRYNAYVAEQAKAKAASPAPPARAS